MWRVLWLACRKRRLARPAPSCALAHRLLRNRALRAEGASVIPKAAFVGRLANVSGGCVTVCLLEVRLSTHFLCSLKGHEHKK